MVPTTIGIFSLYILNPLKPYSVVRKKNEFRIGWLLLKHHVIISKVLDHGKGYQSDIFFKFDNSTL